ncbi:ABC transporter permease DevC [Pseudanabaena sp. PCC 6802]|uniref:ABC transporter permease DevC n=1 Tax=Pseudanabaena sp. PCC 6802 TaxID=118173 RepID=UPI00034708E4|nr:ABC transporter permease DevC [Pseudanabaena sp. PCC 6802]
MLLHRTPLAWFNLTYRTRRLVTAISGVSFAVLLMCMFKGFENAYYDSQIQLLQKLNGEIFIVNRLKYTMFIPEQFARRRLYQAQAFDGVVAAYPVYMNTGNWKNPITKAVRPLRAIAFNPHDPVLPLPSILQHRQDMQMPWTVLVDDKSKDDIGSKQTGVVTELAEQRVRIVGTYSIGTDFASDNGNIVMSDQNFLRYFAQAEVGKKSRNLNTVDIGLLKVAPGKDVDLLAKTLRQQLPQDVAVWTKAEFIQKELDYWRNNTDIGFVFALLAGMSFAVGVILVYQILYTDVAEHSAEYATLKAMGYSNLFLLGIVFQESLILACVGFVPGLAMSFGLYHLTSSATGLFMQLTVGRALAILVATFMMCLVSGAIAVRKVLSSDPAEVFA